MDAPTNFPHRRNEEGACESICKSCFATVATAQSEAELQNFERAHICDPLWANKVDHGGVPRNLLWMEKCYFSGWICSECSWRISALPVSRQVGYHVTRSAFDTHDCSQNQHTSSRVTHVTRLHLVAK
jgi:hypothetical protein